MKTTRVPTSPRTRLLKRQMRNLIKQLRANVSRVNEAQARALFETSAEVVTGLVKAFDDYEKKSEPAWKSRA